jgi:hypothetical protein
MPFDIQPRIRVRGRFLRSQWDNRRLAGEVGKKVAFVVEDVISYIVAN